MTNNEPDYDNLYFERKPMTQKVFDTNNAEDMALLWSILPDGIKKISCNKLSQETSLWSDLNLFTLPIGLIKINWHDKKEITRPIQEATEADIGKLCKFWDDERFLYFGILDKIENINKENWYRFRASIFQHCRRLTKQEIEELI